MNAQVLRRMKATVFNGEDAGYSCPTCLGGMVKAPVSTTQSEPIEVDGCLKCGSLWFDNREIQPFVPDIQHLAPIPEDDPIGKAISSVLQWEKAIIRAITSLSGRNTDDSEE